MPIEVTPFTEHLTEGQTVTLTVPLKIKKWLIFNYKFQKWNDGNTNNTRTITVTSDLSLTAIYTFSWR